MSDLKKRDSSTSTPAEEPAIELGQWYWVQDERGQEWFGCVVYLGSNYAEVSSLDEGTVRIHLDTFWKECRLEPDPESVIQSNTDRLRGKVDLLLARVQEVTARLGVGPTAELPSGSETQALATLDAAKDYSGYKRDLVKAKDDLLPGLFKAIEATHKSLASWMKARVIPLKAQSRNLSGVIDRVEQRIFNVELYAGLCEKVVQVTDGTPAVADEKIRLLQRRCYMDEECLARYETGGMEFRDLEDFDAWLAKPENRDRILPHPRCIVSFQVRRNSKDRGVFGSFIQLFANMAAEKLDQKTFLYIRNGDQIFRMGTDLEFGPKLFPDLDVQKLSGKLWAKVSGSARVSEIITDNEYQALKQEYAEEVAKDEQSRQQTKAFHAEWKKAKAEAKAKGEAFDAPEPWCSSFRPTDPTRDFKPYDPSTVYYDDIVKKVADDIQHHNRIALILQGLLDRSPILHPHPAWKIWTPEGFQQALVLVYDESRALSAGDKPDFEAYRMKLNQSLKAGSVTVGQELAWMRIEAKKENEKNTQRSFEYEIYRPYGNPGPGLLARVAKFGPRTRDCTYVWQRERKSWTEEGTITSRVTIPSADVLCLDAYTPGDFHIFFDDPRTRADYLQWAPLLLAAEEYLVGNLSLGEPGAQDFVTRRW